MKKVFKIITTTCLLIIPSCDLEPFTQPSDDLSLPVLDVYLSDDNHLKLLANKNINLEVPAEFKYNSKKYTGYFRASGARSREFFRWSYRVRLDEEQYIESNNVFNLSAQIHDETMLYTTLTSALYKRIGFPLFKSKHIFLRINGKDEGLYPMFEKIEKEFFKDRGLKLAELFKAGSQLKLSFDVATHPSLKFDKEYPDDENYNTLIDLYHAIDLTNKNNIDEILGKVLDIHLYLKYHAMTSVINSVDAFRNNFFLWKEDISGPLKILPWDFDSSFNTRFKVGIYGQNKIIEKLLANEQYFNQYKAEVAEILNSHFTEGFTFGIIDSTANEIRDGYNLDPFLGGVYNFDDKVSKFKEYISARREFIRDELGNFEFAD